jgi:two-component system, sensor histidine kinase and response regulator
MARLAVIDDDRAFCETLQEILAPEGFVTRFATEGLAGIALVREWRPDLVICDLHMEGPSGFDVLQELRKDRLTASVPVLFLTADRSDALHRAGMELGADDFLGKSTGYDALLRSIRARLARCVEIQRESDRRLVDLRVAISHSVPHEFLTPLTGVLGLSSFLVEEGATLPPDSVHDAAVGILEAGQRLQQLIEKFLLFAELELLSREPRSTSMDGGREGDNRALAAAAGPCGLSSPACASPLRPTTPALRRRSSRCGAPSP